VNPKPIQRLLVANRGEIAVRILRACRELGIETVQVYSEADRDSLPVRMADRAVCIGPARAADSYLRADFIMSAAQTHGAQAIHPGYGFLSENAAFARMCREAGLIFVGPTPEVIDLMGEKSQARRMAVASGVPVTPGSDGTVADADHARLEAERVGYPVLLKAAAGGGGRGMRRVDRAVDIEQSYVAASREALAAFGDGALYVERFLTRVRHIEVQILSDGHNVLHLGERDCSIQRRNQKLVEESPSPALAPEMRQRIGAAAVQLCRHVGYTSAGTIECILDEASSEFFFMEMNTRVQVEHPVTELVTGIDIVKEQIRIAQGEPLRWRQEDVCWHGHAIECRINAEDPDAGFAPSPGLLGRVHWPGGPGIRVDTHVVPGYRVPPYYDPLLGKLLAWGADRQEALDRMARALDELQLEGLRTTAAFHRALMDNPDFRRGEVHTRYVEEFLWKDRS
jgi:acetyl-CoA carboxylase biotin carboxylase subunit